MRNERNNFMGMMPPFNSNFPANMMMFPNYLNDNYNNLENKINSFEKKLKVLENRVSRLENPYQNNIQQPYTNQADKNTYQTTQNNNSYNGEMYMM